MPKQSPPSNGSESYDYIVVGAGTAGCVLAARLSERPDVSVLLLEAGGTDEHEDVADPTRWTALLGTKLDWGWPTTPQRHADKRVVHCPRGKMLGGCASHNASVWVHGLAADFDGWAYAGNPGWDAASAFAVYRRVEDWKGAPSERRGRGGPVHVEPPSDPNPVARAFVAGAKEVGLPSNEDHNAGRMEGVAYFNFTIKDGKRYSVVPAYLQPAMGRKNLRVVTGAEARRLVFAGTRCVGVEWTQRGKARTTRADREVILAAGAINSPRALLLSGVGPARDLKRLKVPVVADLAGVGKNLQDHLLLAGVNYEAKTPLPPPHNNGAEATLWWKSNPRLYSPDLQPVVLEFPFATPELASQVPANAYAIAPGLVRAASRGSVTLKSANPSVPPLIDMNYLGRDADVTALLAGVDLCRAIGAAKAFDALRLREVMPGPLGKDDMRRFVRQSVTTFFHPTSTCAMGIGADSVVDPTLRVHGVLGLRVADASIMPTVTTGNTNAPTVMIAEKAAEMILASAPRAL